MARDNPIDSEEIRAAFEVENRTQTIANIRVGCYLGMVLMPVGVLLDMAVYPESLERFFKLRLGCSFLIFLFLGIVVSPVGERHYRKLGVILAMIPSFFMSWMIYERQGAGSPYYAGLNLVLLVVGFVLRWTLVETATAVGSVVAMYLAACLLRGVEDVTSQLGIFGNNLYFLAISSIIIGTGNYFQSRLRYKEFAYRHQVEASQRMLQESNEKLKELDQVKSRFFANISHELRTPLTLLISPLEKLRSRPPGYFAPELQQQFEMMHDNGMRLLKHINDLLELVRLESGRHEIRMEPVEIESFLGGVLNGMRRFCEEKRQRIHFEPVNLPAAVLADRDKLDKVLMNLLFNSVKFTPAGGTIRLCASWSEGQLEIMVKDTGVGIAPEHLPHVFDRFWQADDSSRRRFQGTGLGLALVKELVEALSGTVTVESQLGVGTSMNVVLPCPVAETASQSSKESSTSLPNPPARTVAWEQELYRKAEHFAPVGRIRDAQRKAELSAPFGRGRMKVLVADDEPDMRRFVSSELAAEFDVIEAADGREAVEKISQFLPEAVVVDMMMPEKDGMEVCREIRSKTATQATPVLMLTARADDATKLLALESGANDFLTKPFSTTELLVRVRNLVENSIFQRSLARQKKVLEATIEQLKDTESQLVHSEKMASLGRLSAGIIHEINNPLNYVKTTLYTLRRLNASEAGPSKPDVEEMLKDIEDGVNRVQTIVTSLRSFSHPNHESRAEEQVRRLAEDALRFVSHETRGQITINNLVPETQTIYANRNQVIQVLVNLLQNSIDAVKKRPAGDSEGSIWIEGKSTPNAELLTVKDNGCGIPPEVIGRVFDPFFTTKDVGQGMGLGLSICYRIMQDHGGRILVESQPNIFSQFTLEFPVHAQARREAA